MWLPGVDIWMRELSSSLLLFYTPIPAFPADIPCYTVNRRRLFPASIVHLVRLPLPLLVLIILRVASFLRFHRLQPLTYPIRATLFFTSSLAIVYTRTNNSH